MSKRIKINVREYVEGEEISDALLNAADDAFGSYGIVSRFERRAAEKRMAEETDDPFDTYEKGEL